MASMATSTARAPGRKSMILQANCSFLPLAHSIPTRKNLSIQHTPFHQPSHLTLGHSAARSPRYGACCRCSAQRGFLHERPHRQLAPAPCCFLLPHSRAIQDHHGSQGNEARTSLPLARQRPTLFFTKAFPSDRYAVRSQVQLHGLDPDLCIVEVAPREGEQVCVLHVCIRELPVDVFLFAHIIQPKHFCTPDDQAPRYSRRHRPARAAARLRHVQVTLQPHLNHARS